MRNETGEGVDVNAEIRSRRCCCGQPKVHKTFFCGACFGRLPEVLRAALWMCDRVGAYLRARAFLMEGKQVLALKAGVRISGMRPEIVLAAVAAMQVYAAAGHDLTITACVDGKHMSGSLHYAGAAIDLRTNGIGAEELQRILAQIKQCLGPDFDALLEADHMHIEFQPKAALTN